MKRKLPDGAGEIQSRESNADYHVNELLSKGQVGNSFSCQVSQDIPFQLIWSPRRAVFATLAADYLHSDTTKLEVRGIRTGDIDMINLFAALFNAFQTICGVPLPQQLGDNAN